MELTYDTTPQDKKPEGGGVENWVDIPENNKVNL